MKEFITILEKNPMGCLSTIEKGRPRVRPWGYMMNKNGKLWFCTSSQKNVYQQLQDCPKVEFTTSTEEFTTLRISGEVTFSDDCEVKKEIITKNELVKNIYKSPDNPIFKVFFIEHGEASIADFSGKPPIKIIF